MKTKTRSVFFTCFVDRLLQAVIGLSFLCVLVLVGIHQFRAQPTPVSPAPAPAPPVVQAPADLLNDMIVQAYGLKSRVMASISEDPKNPGLLQDLRAVKDHIARLLEEQVALHDRATNLRLREKNAKTRAEIRSNIQQAKEIIDGRGRDLAIREKLQDRDTPKRINLDADQQVNADQQTDPPFNRHDGEPSAVSPPSSECSKLPRRNSGLENWPTSGWLGSVELENESCQAHLGAALPLHTGQAGNLVSSLPEKAAKPAQLSPYSPVDQRQLNENSTVPSGPVRRVLEDHAEQRLSPARLTPADTMLWRQQEVFQQAPVDPPRFFFEPAATSVVGLRRRILDPICDSTHAFPPQKYFPPQRPQPAVNRIYDAPAGETFRLPSHCNINSLTWLRETVVLGTTHGVWCVDPGGATSELPGYSGSVLAVEPVVLQGDSYIASGGRSGKLTLTSLEIGLIDSVTVPGPPSDIWSVAFSSSKGSGHFLAAGHGRHISIYRVSTNGNLKLFGHFPKAHSLIVRAVEFLDENHLASCSLDRTIKIWQIEPAGSLTLTDEISLKRPLVAMAVRGNLVACGGRGPEIEVYDWHSGRRVATWVGNAQVCALCFHEKGLLVGTRGGGVTVLGADFAPFAQLTLPTSQSIWGVGWSDGRIAIGSWADGKLSVWR